MVTSSPSVELDCAFRCLLLDPIAGHSTIAFFRQLAVGDEQGEGATEIGLGAGLVHHVAFAETGLETFGSDEGAFFLLGDFLR